MPKLFAVSRSAYATMLAICMWLVHIQNHTLEPCEESDPVC